MSFVSIAGRAYQRYAAAISLLQHPLLLACRVYWGHDFMVHGYGKLAHLGTTAEQFAYWKIPLPYAGAVAAGTAETVCGGLLLVGVASRIITLPLIFTMIVAYFTAHADDVTSIFTFVTAPPFLNLLTCVLVLVFGPGVFSLDWLLGRMILGPPAPAQGKP